MTDTPADRVPSVLSCVAARATFVCEPIAGVRIEVREHGGARVAVVLRNGELAVVAPMPRRARSAGP